MQIFGFLGSLLGYVLWGAFYLLKDFGLSIIVFTIIVRLCMFPFTIKQQKSMAGTARLSKKQKEIQEKYKNNRLDTACELLNCYNSNMSVSSKSFLEKVKNYKSSIRNRIAFLFYKDINCGIIASDVITRIIILFGCY